MAHPQALKNMVIQLGQLIFGQRKMSRLFIFDAILSERIIVKVHVTGVDGFVDEGTELSEMFANCIGFAMLHLEKMFKVADKDKVYVFEGNVRLEFL